ncbi:MAG: hypothetical protein KGL39_53320, partial [Patescibacteria group bacterium]|nr:hypothetical protein [Patescibacteria group bacterium]
PLSAAWAPFAIGAGQVSSDEKPNICGGSGLPGGQFTIGTHHGVTCQVCRWDYDDKDESGILAPHKPRVPDLDLYFMPDCSVCDDGGDMNYDDGFYCEMCGHQWNRDGTHGEYVDE